MRRTPYFKRASKRFLEGTRCKTPCEAVEAGAKTLEQWAMLLEQERDVEQAYVLARQLPRKRRFVVAS